MKKTALLIVIIVNIAAVLNAQNDPASQKILDSFSSKALAAQSVTMKFELVTTDQVENTNNTLNGSIVLNNDRYKLILPDNTVWFNGSYTWSYIPEVNEVTITKPQPGDEDFLSKPSSIFTLYKKGYKNRLITETSAIVVIDLYPEDIKSELIRLRLTITKPGMELKSAEYKTKEGLEIKLNVTLFDLKLRYDPAFFSFNAKEYSGVEIIDLKNN